MNAIKTCPVLIGGLFRCCIGAIPKSPRGEFIALAEGTIIPCPHCGGGVQFVGGAWQARWIKAKEEKA